MKVEGDVDGVDVAAAPAAAPKSKKKTWRGKKPVAVGLGTIDVSTIEQIEDYKICAGAVAAGGRLPDRQCPILHLRAETKTRHPTSPTSGGGVRAG